MWLRAAKNLTVSFWQGNEPLGSYSAEFSRLTGGLPASEEEMWSMALVSWWLVKQHQKNNYNIRTPPFLIIRSDSVTFWRDSMKNPAMSMACREIGHETADIRRNVKDKWETTLPDKPVCILTFRLRFPSWSLTTCRWVTDLSYLSAHLSLSLSLSLSLIAMTDIFKKEFITFFAENEFFFHLTVEA